MHAFRITRPLQWLPPLNLNSALNLAGATQTQERKRQIYSICSEFNILIVEDDPYYYLQYTPGEGPRGLQGLGASYLSMDTECRVLRLDSFSKVILLALLALVPNACVHTFFHPSGININDMLLSATSFHIVGKDIVPVVWT